MPNEKKPKNEAWKGKNLRQIGLVGALPMIMAAGPLIGYFGGKWLDGKLGTDPIMMIILLVLGCAASVKETINILREAGRGSEDEEL